ncbi:MAG TPA: HD domain-containing protein [Mucilaginibacter sp.]
MRLKDAGDHIIKKLTDGLPTHLSYHNVSHTLDVYEAAKRLGAGEGLTDDEITLLLTAAYYHDSGFLIKMNGHEEESCRIARETLPAFDYTEEQIDAICVMIMATRLPQSPQNHLSQILADADLDYLGRDDFFEIGDKLFRELSFYGDDMGRAEWDRKQIAFLENHQYFTKTAINLRQAKKDANLGRIKHR